MVLTAWCLLCRAFSDTFTFITAGLRLEDLNMVVRRAAQRAHARRLAVQPWQGLSPWLSTHLEHRALAQGIS